MTKNIFDAFLPNTIGFDTWKIPTPASFPKYDIVKEEDGTYRMSMALAGYGKSDIAVKHNSDGTLVVEGSLDIDSDAGKYLHQGIAKRNFRQAFALDKSLVVKEAEMENGLLNIVLSREDDEVNVKLIPVK